jgi:hypothetical protein
MRRHLLPKAEIGKFPDSTIERKQMSTKTTFKRIALVAVAALGAGVLSVAPASATANPDLTVPTVGTRVQTASVGATVTTTAGFTTGGALADTEAWGTGSAKTAVISISKPSDSTVGLANRDGAISTSADSIFSTTGMTTGLGSAMNTSTGALTGTATAAVSAAAVVAGTVTIIPDVPGVYTVTVSTSAATSVATIYVYTSALNSASLIGWVGDGGLPSNNASFNGVAGPANTVQVRAFPSTTSSIRRLIVVEGSDAYIAGSAGETLTLAAGTTPKSGTIASNADASAFTTVTIATPSVGTVTAKIFSETAASSGIFSATAAATVTITVATAGSAGTVSVTNSTVFGNSADSAASATTDLAVPSSMMGTGTVAFKARYDIKVRDVLNALRAASTTALTASVSGPGLLNTSNSTSGAGRVAAINWDGSLASLYLFNDGTAGVSTVTISWGTTVLATKTVTFTGSARTLTATAIEPHLTVGTIDDALEIVAKDANGNVTEYTPVISSGTPGVVSNSLGSCARATVADSIAYGYTVGGYYCDVVAVATGSSVITVNPGSVTTNIPTVTFKVTKTVATSVVLTTDKATYAPGEAIKLTITAKDSNGDLLGAKQVNTSVYYDLLAADSTSTVAVQGTQLSGTSIYLSAGTKTTTLYAPLVSGPVTFRATLSGDAVIAPALAGSVITATVTVSETPAEATAQAAADAAAEATDAANAATDAANAAAEAADAATAAAQDAADAVAALSTQVTEMVNALKKQITALTNLVIKIQKKVRA